MRAGAKYAPRTLRVLPTLCGIEGRADRLPSRQREDNCPAKTGMESGLKRIRVALFSLPFYLFFIGNGIYLPKLASDPQVFWMQDLASWLLVAPLCLYLIIKYAGPINSRQLGIPALSEAKAWRETAYWSVITAIGFPLLFHIIDSLPLSIFFVFIGPKADFSIQEVLPIYPARLLAVAYLSLTAGIFEEIFTRAVPYLVLTEAISRSVRRIVYIVLSSVLFAAGHWEQGAKGVASVFFFGIVLATYYSYKQALIPLITGHVANDVVIFSSF